MIVNHIKTIYTIEVDFSIFSIIFQASHETIEAIEIGNNSLNSFFMGLKFTTYGVGDTLPVKAWFLQCASTDWCIKCKILHIS